MARQNTTPVPFQNTVRTDEGILMTTGRAGKVVPVAYIPTAPGDSASGRVQLDLELAEMPRPLLNGVMVNAQAWFVPKSAHPKFTGMEELQHAFTGFPIKGLKGERTPPEYYTMVDPTDVSAAEASEFFDTLGMAFHDGASINTDLIDAFALVYNFRLAAHSDNLPKRPYAEEDLAASTALPRAFWPTGRWSAIVGDYERALVVGALDLDVAAGQLPVLGIGPLAGATAGGATTITEHGDVDVAHDRHFSGHLGNQVKIAADPTGTFADIYVELAGQTIPTTLAAIDKARETQAFAKMRASMAGNDTSGFDNDDALVALMMQGLRPAPEDFRRPWLLDSSRVPVGFIERHATDAANLDASVSVGDTSVSLSLNVPRTETEGMIIVTVELLPEKLDERQSDEWLYHAVASDLPDALRDVQRPEPVDMVLNRRLDAKHTTPNGFYGYEPMNRRFNRNFTRLGGKYRQLDPLNPFLEQRAAIWQANIVDPTYSEDHFLVPEDFPHDVFADTQAPAFRVVSRHSVSITGLTQFGDVLSEANDDYAAITDLT